MSRNYISAVDSKPNYIARVPEMPQVIPGLTVEQNHNTMEFLGYVANTGKSDLRCLIMEQHTLTRDTFVRQRNQETGKMEYKLEEGKRIIAGRKGIDLTKPAVFAVAENGKLLRKHKNENPKIEFRNSKPVAETQNKLSFIHCAPLLESIIKTAETMQRLYFLPALVAPKALHKKMKTSSNATFYSINNYSSNDVVAGRCLWVGIDGHTCPIDKIYHANLKAIDRLNAVLPAYCQNTGIPMPIVINSGCGVHLYWWFDKPVALKNTEIRAEFQWLLKKMADWAKELINQDQICRELWKVNYEAAKLYHLMSLPGCVHPETGQRQYVVNKHGRDYYLYSYDVICDSVKNRCEPELPETHKECFTRIIPAENLCQAEADCIMPHEASEDSVHRKQEGILNLEGRINKLVHWAKGRSWNLTGRRELFLFCCGVALQCDATFDVTDEANYPLHALNNHFTEPLMDNEVNILIQKLVSRAQANNMYKMRDKTIAKKLGMTAEEQECFCAPASLSLGAERTPEFLDMFNEILQQEPWDNENEPIVSHRDRCYQLTCEWYTNRRKERKGKTYSNAARTRRRKAKPGYSKKGGRPKTYTNRDREMCQSLKEKGLSIRQIADQTGLSKSAVGRMLKI